MKKILVSFRSSKSLQKSQSEDLSQSKDPRPLANETSPSPVTLTSRGDGLPPPSPGPKTMTPGRWIRRSLALKKEPSKVEVNATPSKSKHSSSSYVSVDVKTTSPEKVEKVSPTTERSFASYTPLAMPETPKKAKRVSFVEQIEVVETEKTPDKSKGKEKEKEREDEKASTLQLSEKNEENQNGEKGSFLQTSTKENKFVENKNGGENENHNGNANESSGGATLYKSKSEPVISDEISLDKGSPGVFILKKNRRKQIEEEEPSEPTLEISHISLNSSFTGVPSVVIDSGSGLCKSGFSGDTHPRSIIPTIVGRPKHEGVLHGDDYKDSFVGDEVQAKRGVLALQYPIEHGIIKNWDDMEKIWHHIFHYELKVEPENQPVFLSEPPFNPKDNREQMGRLMFDTFSVPGLYIGMNAVLALHSGGRTTGMVVDSGDGVSYAVPIYEGHAISHGIQRRNLGGRDVTEYMARIFSERGIKFSSSGEREVVREIKEALSFVAYDLDVEMERARTSSVTEKPYQLPDGQVLFVNTERFRGPEVLFNPSLIGSEVAGLPETTFNAISKCDKEVRKHLYANVVLSGGSCSIPGFADRLHKELAMLAFANTQIKVIPPENKNSVWLGASILSSLSTFSQRYITKAEYDEIGPSILQRKCY